MKKVFILIMVMTMALVVGCGSNAVEGITEDQLKTAIYSDMGDYSIEFDVTINEQSKIGEKLHKVEGVISVPLEGNEDLAGVDAIPEDSEVKAYYTDIIYVIDVRDAPIIKEKIHEGEGSVEYKDGLEEEDEEESVTSNREKVGPIDYIRGYVTDRRILGVIEQLWNKSGKEKYEILEKHVIGPDAIEVKLKRTRSGNDTIYWQIFQKDTGKEEINGLHLAYSYTSRLIIPSSYYEEKEEE